MDGVKLITCETCGAQVDPRKLGDVMAHGWYNKETGGYECYDSLGDVQYSTARKVGESVAWTRDGKKLNLN